ncbi:MAG: hypothetical protein EBS76_08660 [Actinobacteria bacterium]|nr:hypothetical protein [Actinomycetota bacterium]
MSLDISCPNCETDEHLTGQRTDAVIVVTCSNCSLSWERPAAPHCDRCGSTDVIAEIRKRGSGHLPPSLS